MAEALPGGRLRRRHDDLAVVETGEQRVAMLDLRRLAEPPMVLEGVAAVIWHLLDGTRTEDEVVSEVAGLAGLQPADVAADVGAFLADLGRRDLLALEASDASEVHGG